MAHGLHKVKGIKTHRALAWLPQVTARCEMQALSVWQWNARMQMREVTSQPVSHTRLTFSLLHVRPISLQTSWLATASKQSPHVLYSYCSASAVVDADNNHRDWDPVADYDISGL